MTHTKLEGKLVSFTTNKGLKLFKVPVLAIVTGTDGKLYVRVKKDGKYFLKQKDSIKSLQNL